MGRFCFQPRCRGYFGGCVSWLCHSWYDKFAQQRGNVCFVWPIAVRTACGTLTGAVVACLHWHKTLKHVLAAALLGGGVTWVAAFIVAKDVEVVS